MVQISMSTIKKLENDIKNGNLTIGYNDDLNKDLKLPIYFYLQHWKTGEYKFVEINEEFVRYHFVHLKFVTKSHIVRKINDQNYRILIEGYTKLVIFKELKKRHEKLMESKKELDVIHKIFDENPEYVV